MVDFVAGFGDKSATTSILQLLAVYIVANSVADMVNFVADTVDSNVYGAKATWSTLSTFNKVDRV